MPGLSFGKQSQNRRSGLWWVPIVLIVISVMLITLCVRFGNSGPFAVARGVVQTVTKPVERVCSLVSTPFSNIGAIDVDEEVARLKEENSQLRTLVAELEEYRQQDQRLTAMMQFADIYGLETLSAEVVSTTTGWDRTATINKGSRDGVRVGMAVMSTCGLYGQVESVTDASSVVRLINDANSSVAAMVQNSRAHGILHGAYDGTLTLEYVPIDMTVGEGDIVIASGSGGVYPRGIVIGTVRTIETDSSKLYHRIIVEPLFNIESCEEVLVLTGNETETERILNEELLQTIIDSANSVNASSAQVGAVAKALLNEANEAYRAAEEQRQAAERAAREPDQVAKRAPGPARAEVARMSKQVVYAITIVLCILLQAGISPAIAIMGCSPNFLLIPVLLISMRSGTGMGSIAGFLLGLLYDLMGSGTIGCMALVFTLIAFIVGVAGESMDLLTPVATIIVAALSSLILEVGYGIAAILTSSEGGGVMSTMLSYSLPSALYTAVFAVIALVTISLVIADDNAGMPTHLGERRDGGMRGGPRMKSRLK